MQNSNILRNLLSDLISINSTTPDVQCVSYLSEYLSKHGFKCEYKVFNDTANLYATIGNVEKCNLCFSGHLDVVSIIDKSLWTFPPFKLTEYENKIYGRGAVDMKSSVAAFTTALINNIESLDLTNCGISMLITGDEEGSGENGTKKMLEYLESKDVGIDYCIIGEPTGCHKSFDSVNIGRRGSMNFTIKIQGKEGHVAYPSNFINPISTLTEVCYKLKNIEFENNTDDKTNLEITSIDAVNDTTNIVPPVSWCRGNIRFNYSKYNALQLEKIIHDCCTSIIDNKDAISIECASTHTGYHCPINNFSEMVINEVKKHNVNATFSMRGGVTDGSFISAYCNNICEIGPLDHMMHKIDEHISIEELTNLESLYFNIIKKFTENK